MGNRSAQPGCTDDEARRHKALCLSRFHVTMVSFVVFEVSYSYNCVSMYGCMDVGTDVGIDAWMCGFMHI